MPKDRLREGGFTVSKETKIQKVLDALKNTPLQTKQIASVLGIRREPAYRDYIKLLLEQNKIKKVEGTDLYQLANQDFDHNVKRQEILTESEFMNTKIMQGWQKRNHAKNEHKCWTRFANICFGKVNPKFRLHPDTWTNDTYEDLVKNTKDAIIEANGKKDISKFDKMILRHVIKYGLGTALTKEEAKNLGIEGDKDAPSLATLHITWEQYGQLKQTLKNDKELLVKFGFCAWTFCRPSTRYTIKLDDLIFYDREIEYILVDGEKVTEEKELKHLKFLLKFLPKEIQDQFPIVKKTERACKLDIHEFKTASDFPKRIFDEELVKELEKIVRIRKSQRKKYLFWENNDTEFVFETYDKIVMNHVSKDNALFLKLLENIGFKSGDYGKTNRVNYAIRHFGIQLWLQSTNYDYALVSEMSHADIATLRNYYGRMVGQHFDKKLGSVSI